MGRRNEPNLRLSGAVNRNSIFKHGEHLLHELQRKRPLGRPVIFVTHSLGRILLKETLGLCSSSAYPAATEVVDNIAGKVFMGLPRHGSLVAHVGENFRKLASFALMGTNALILDSLSLKNLIWNDASTCFQRSGLSTVSVMTPLLRLQAPVHSTALQETVEWYNLSTKVLLKSS
ncbi:predicted protein [Verticillium alfalfae VaMs.102]|uniref:Predicted protein n=1 Tax=Verticillium alfalfae (strain VaMs.102 / ATCC MYA-4576 / FGSC 10136) TaxID=526221 RepID=C9SWF0_VERA1|nr:predicted protein [Verticillium alfalfae VaMs.102]EEY23115.1 predicted protein [Verticillium alfalfae VaMs.102]